ncbi:unnamed protein product [Adineta ricciae]|uniref:Ionotropic glutamate receptor C-terminal domain-containing protein n=1 Tax=Adineta ricciae TaxID=249248 RepID=A0A814ZVR0_ADIRI|nr:unnamed protein product [Adineta ricciae]CAF1404893.1 unnamed protein product [Adineta ricciae]
MFKAAITIAQRYNITIGGQFIGWETIQMSDNVIETLHLTCEAVSNSNIVSIVGPTFSDEEQIIPLFANRIGLPLISYKITNPDFFDREHYQRFYYTILSKFKISENTTSESNNMTLLDTAFEIWKQYEPESFPGVSQVNPYSLFVLDATWRLIQFLQYYCTTERKNSTSCFSFVKSSTCFNRRLIQSDSLLTRIHTTEFIGVNDTYTYMKTLKHPSYHNRSLSRIPEYAAVRNWQAHTNGSNNVWAAKSNVLSRDMAILKGIHLRIGVIASTPFTIVNSIIDQSGQNITQLSGYVPDLIELLQNQMGFIADIQLASSNQTYTGLIQAVLNGTYDIVVADITVTSSRRQLVSFSNSIFDSALCLLIRKTSESDLDLLAFLKPFSRNLWLLILGVAFFASILFCFIERQENEALQKISKSSSMIMSMWFSIGTIMGYGADYQGRTAAGRILTVGLYMLSMVLVASYTANLASNLTLSKSKNIISGIEDVKDGKVAYNRIGVRTGTAGESYFLNEISNGNRNYYSMQSVQDMIESLLSDKVDVCLMDRSAADYLTNNIYCNLTIVGEDFYPSIFGMVIPQGWIYEQDLDIQVLSLRENGSLDDLKTKWFKMGNCPDVTNVGSAMGIKPLGGLFLTFGVICVLVIVKFLWRKRCFCRRCPLLSRFPKTVVFNNNASNSVINI